MSLKKLLDHSFVKRMLYNKKHLLQYVSEQGKQGAKVNKDSN